MGYPAMVAAVKSYSPDSGAFSTWLLYYLQTEFAEATGYRTKQGKHEPLNNAFSLDKPLGDDGEGELFGDLIPDHRAAVAMDSVEELEFRKQLHNALENALDMLPEEYGDVLRLRYYKGMTQEESGRVLGISGEQTRQREGKGLRKLRAPKMAASLRSFYDFDYFSGTGMSSFRNTGLSVQERYLIQIESRSART